MQFKSKMKNYLPLISPGQYLFNWNVHLHYYSFTIVKALCEFYGILIFMGFFLSMAKFSYNFLSTITNNVLIPILSGFSPMTSSIQTKGKLLGGTIKQRQQNIIFLGQMLRYNRKK